MNLILSNYEFSYGQDLLLSITKLLIVLRRILFPASSLTRWSQSVAAETAAPDANASVAAEHASYRAQRDSFDSIPCSISRTHWNLTGVPVDRTSRHQMFDRTPVRSRCHGFGHRLRNFACTLGMVLGRQAPLARAKLRRRAGGIHTEQVISSGSECPSVR